MCISETVMLLNVPTSISETVMLLNVPTSISETVMLLNVPTSISETVMLLKCAYVYLRNSYVVKMSLRVSQKQVASMTLACL